eukprot:g10598.t1
MPEPSEAPAPAPAAPAPAPAAPAPTPAAPAPPTAPVPVEVQDLGSDDDPNWGCGLLGKLPGINQDPAAVFAAAVGRPRLETGTGGTVSFAELETAGYRPVELLETDRYLRDVAGQEERRPPTGGREEAAAEPETAHEEEPVEVEMEPEVPNEPMVKLRQAPTSQAIPSPVESFEDAKVVLHTKLMAPLLANGFEQPTLIQSYALPIVAAGRDLIGAITARSHRISATGSGKTLAYLLPSFSRLLRCPGPITPECWPLLLVLGPTRELVAQILVTATCGAALHVLRALAGYLIWRVWIAS